MKTKIEKYFGEYVLSDEILKKYLSKSNYLKYKNTKLNGESLDKEIAKEIAKAIKTWALKLGATHFSHWFFPLSGKTAEKQVSFVELSSNGKIIENFSEKDLIKGEADASNFPNGGKRMTFEARGYTIWDYTSPVFIKEDNYKNKVLYIPTAFCSYTGLALDEKTPLLRALESLNINALKILKFLGYDDVKRVNFFAGVEQEYFLINKDLYNERKDLKMVGRTLFGDSPLKSQEDCHHYFGMIEDDISKFMNEVDVELWKMGIMAKHQHKEAAPCQFEFVPIFNTVNIASDQNEIIMNVISKVADRHNMVAIFHEKPFNKLNGSGKHENWSMSTDTGINLFNIDCKDENLFFAFYVAMITAINKYSGLLRYSTAYYENDLRLGGEEAPPALISVFASDYVAEKFNNYLNGNCKNNTEEVLNLGVKHLPKMYRDFSDRNRTAPICFNENKFEFRMVGSSQSVAWPSTCMCTALAGVLSEMAKKLESCKENKIAYLKNMLKEMIIDNERVIYNGNCYEEAWKNEAKKRGLIEYKNTVSCFDVLSKPEIKDLFISTGVLNDVELEMRENAKKENYLNTLKLEANTMISMLNENILFSLDDLLKHFDDKTKYSKELHEKIKNVIDELFEKSERLGNVLKNNDITKNIDEIFELMKTIRKLFDDIEKLIPIKFKPFPTYDEILA